MSEALHEARIADVRDRHDLVLGMVGSLDDRGLKELADATADPDLDDLLVEVLRAYTATAAASDPRWAVTFVGWLAGTSLTGARALRVVSDVAWARRQRGQDVLDSLSLHDLLSLSPESDECLAGFLIFLQAARFDFNFELIARALVVLPEAVRRRMPDYFQALALFADYGRGQHSRSPQVLEVAELATDPKILHALAHALWFSSREDDSEALVRVTQRILEINDQDSVARLRQSAGLRRLGRFEEALATVNRGIADCPPLSLEMNDMLIDEQQRVVLQADLVAKVERSTSVAVDRFETMIRETEDRIRGELHEELDRARNATSDAMFKVVEILGLFTAIIAVVATGFVGGMAGTLVWWQRLVVVLGGAASALAFFVILRVVVRPSKGSR